MATLNFDEEKLRFREYFEENHGLFNRALTVCRGLLTQLLADHVEFATPVVTGRVKSRDECIQKFSHKYQGKCEADQTPYEIKDYITDIVGVRVVCLYETDVPLIRLVVLEHFDVIEETDKSATLESHDDTFGYKGLHLDLRLKENRVALPEYARFKDQQFELQIRTTVQDAWSILDHKIKYKKNIPDTLRRRINRLAALFELADQEFVNIRDETLTLEKVSVDRSVALIGNVATAIAGSFDWGATLNAFTFSRVAQEHFPGYIFDGVKIDGFVGELRRQSPALSDSTLDELLTKLLPIVNEYRQFQRDVFRNRMNPFTTVRHVLYLADKTNHRMLLFDSQRNNFDQWLARREKMGP